jgi:hypothetical protein
MEEVNQSAEQAAALKALKKELKKARKVAASAEGSTSFIESSRSAQMMFKTALRNHIDLTNIADNKANIMLSINALIITIAMPLMAAQVREHPALLLPTMLLLLTCLLSIIFATLATRPVKTNGSVNLEFIGQKPTNLFFFGNFYKMNLPDYIEGLRKVSSSNEYLEEAIAADLFFLGKALGRKFNQLRICYAIFMVGITVTVLSFVLSYLFSS